MSPELIIDGYNLLHYAGLGGLCRRSGKFEQARDQLLLRLKRSLPEKELARTLVVFDAQHAAHADRRPIVVHGMTIVFSPRGRQADDLIEDLLCGTRQPRQLRVVSSDHRLLRAARAVGAGYIDSDSFLVELDKRQSARKQQSFENTPLSPPDRIKTPLELTADDWLKEFGDIDPKEIERSLREEARPQPAPTPTPAPQKNPSPNSPAPDPRTQQPAPPPTRRSGRSVPPPPPISKSEGEEKTVLADELAFWEQRIADLNFEEPHPGSPGQRRGPRKPPSE